MENASNVSSEEELVALRSEGKITERQYEELLGTMTKTPSKEAPQPPAETSESRLRHKRGRTAFTLMLLGLAVPAACFLALEIFGPENASPAIGPWFFLGLGLEVAALVTGILAWPDVLGKATVITIGILTVLSLLFIS